MSTATVNRAVTSTLAATSVGAGSNAQSSSFSPSTKLSYSYEVHFLNGGTGPTVGMTAQAQYTPDGGTTWIAIPGRSAVQTVLTASANSSVWIAIPPDIDYPTRIDLRGNTGQAVTPNVNAHERTSLTIA